MIFLQDFQAWMGMLFGSIIMLIILNKISKKNEKMLGIKMWEILVPASNKNTEFTYEHHKVWDEFVISISGGITVMKTVKGEWVSPTNMRFKDRMIPVRIKCTKKQIRKIIKFTLNHYKQDAVLAYKVSDDVILVNRDKIERDN